MNFECEDPGLRPQLLEPHPPQVPATTAQFSRQLPFQRWFPFKEAFAPQFVADAIARHGKTAGILLDPFGGSGTSALTAQHLGWTPYTIEVNPFLADLIEAKLSTYDTVQLERTWRGIRERVSERGIRLRTLYAQAPLTLFEPGERDRWVFDAVVLRRIAAYRLAIDAVRDPVQRRFFRVQLAATLVPLSNVVVSGKGRRYRRGWETRGLCATDVDARLAQHVREAIADVAAAERPSGRFTVARGDARVELARAPASSLAIFSPPYPNSFDYTDIYNLELWVLGYLTTRADNSRLRCATVHSHVQIVRPPSEPPASARLHACLKALRAARARLWNRHIPEMVGSYFADLVTVLRTIAGRLQPDGRCIVVVGDSRYDAVYVDVAAILEELASHCGLLVIEREPVRSMRVSPQQGGQHGLTETALTFKRITNH